MRDLRPNVTAWANCTDVEKVLYVIPSAAHEVRADVQRMIRTLNAEDKILVVTEKDFLSGNCLAVDRLCVARAGQTAPAASSPRVHAGIARGGRDGGGRTRGSHSRGAIADRSRLARMLS
jgi:hypothetical protein